MEGKIKVGILCFDLQNFTCDFINRLQSAVQDFASIKAYPILDFVGTIAPQFQYQQGTPLSGITAKTFSGNENQTPEGLMISTNYRSALKCARESDVILHYGIHSGTAMLTTLVGKLLGKKVITINQTLPVPWELRRRWWIRFFKRYFIFAWANKHVAQTVVSEQNLTEVYGIPKKNITYIPFEAGVAYFHQLVQKHNKESIKEPKQTTAIRFLFVGNLLRFKGVFLSIDAIKILLDKKYAVRLSIVGPESIDEKEPRVADLQKYVAELGITKNVEVVGTVAYDQLPAVYAAHDVFMLPTMKDCFPKVLVEAALAGKPLLTSDACGGIHSIVQDGVNGFIHLSGNVEDLANKMEHFLLDQHLGDSMGQKSKEIALEFLENTRVEASLYAKLISSFR